MVLKERTIIIMKKSDLNQLLEEYRLIYAEAIDWRKDITQVAQALKEYIVDTRWCYQCHEYPSVFIG